MEGFKYVIHLLLLTVFFYASVAYHWTKKKRKWQFVYYIVSFALIIFLSVYLAFRDIYFDGEIINAHWEMNFSDFDVAYLRKTMNRLWVLMQPQGSSSADIGFITNRSESQSKKHIEYKIQVMDNVDFANFSFQISTNPQPFRLKMKAKKFTNLKIVIDNTERTDCTILQLVLKVESFGESK